ncbi:bile acid:sodium symporter family protein [Aridibaculum aurantiacum]|uniref:bile acid:sodium symporter family protein n=1 Tax=Aridibaculum aurantiacum TaxID=2810307 RepID=UPI001A976F15|nr:bile acid:sodium symporter family protein [Aridibaculum aurantiacum]
MNRTSKPVRAFVWFSSLLVLLSVVLYITSLSGTISSKPALIALVCALYTGLLCFVAIRKYAFTATVILCASIAMIFPQAFIAWNGFSLSLLIVPLMQLIMFGMGTTLSPADFARIARSPLPVLVGLILQFSIMPVVGYILANLFGFEGEIAAGIILIGSCSGGVASNLMTFLAKGNVALSVTMTFFSTLVAPFATPYLMKVFAGAFVPIDPIKMMFSILNMIIVPLLAGLVAHELLYSKRKWMQEVFVLLGLAAAAVVLAVLALKNNLLFGPLANGIMMGSFLIALIIIIKLVMNNVLHKQGDWMDAVLPLISMAGICIIITIIIAQTHEVFTAVGISLLIAAIIHNAVGYTLGYSFPLWIGLLYRKMRKLSGFASNDRLIISEAERRTIAIEVGMQNGGMATGLAIDVLHSHVAALPANLFGTWMNISGSMLANYWQQKPVEDETADEGEKQPK